MATTLSRLLGVKSLLAPDDDFADSLVRVLLRVDIPPGSVLFLGGVKLPGCYGDAPPVFIVVGAHRVSLRGLGYLAV